MQEGAGILSSYLDFLNKLVFVRAVIAEKNYFIPVKRNGLINSLRFVEI
jgi:hypothetical protein